MKNNKNVLVTGGNGFLGSHLTKRLLKDGWSVNLIILNGSSLLPIKDIINKVKIFNYSGKISEVMNAFSISQPYTTFHLGALFLAQHNSEDIINLIKSNILFTTQVAEAMCRNKCNHLINTGTSWQHYKNSPYDPVCLYAATKQAAEDILKYYSEALNLKVINLKLTDNYGPNDFRKKLFALLKSATDTNTRLEMSPGHQKIDIVYVDDVIDAYLTAQKLILGNNFKTMKSFSVSSEQPIKLKDLVNIYETIIGKKLNIIWGGRPYRFREVMIPSIKDKSLPGWKPKMTLTDGIKIVACTKNDTSKRHRNKK